MLYVFSLVWGITWEVAPEDRTRRNVHNFRSRNSIVGSALSMLLSSEAYIVCGRNPLGLLQFFGEFHQHIVQLQIGQFWYQCIWLVARLSLLKHFFNLRDIAVTIKDSNLSINIEMRLNLPYCRRAVLLIKLSIPSFEMSCRRYSSNSLTYASPSACSYGDKFMPGAACLWDSY